MEVVSSPRSVVPYRGDGEATSIPEDLRRWACFSSGKNHHGFMHDTGHSAVTAETCMILQGLKKGYWA
ncbi:hypothetical protein GUJ93_ZPchr0007g6377 [Zizania palustris]|uniref:Uncharacterized protein n=1 Tax=Zizania palustris TaxID=103762 RepID=A0A8J5TJP7_ZIZPA|nr:hypothetical protein GUJ93_ZPchr0007g6377 [Zizania palustris]